MINASTQYGQLHLQQNRQQFNLFLDNHQLSQQNISGLSKIPNGKPLTEKEIQTFIESHAFHVVKGADLIRVHIHTKGLGGGQFFLKLPNGKTITVTPEHGGKTLYQEINQDLKDKEGINLEEGGYMILFNGKPLDQNQQYDPSMKEATFHLQKRFMANPSKEEAPQSVPMQHIDKTLDQTPVILVLPDGRNLEVPFDKRSQTTMIPFIEKVLWDKDKSNFTGLFTATILGQPLDNFTNISDVQGKKIHVTYNRQRQQTQPHPSKKANSDLPPTQSKNPTAKKYPPKKSESGDLGGAILSITIFGFAIFGFYRASKSLYCSLKNRVIRPVIRTITRTEKA